MGKLLSKHRNDSVQSNYIGCGQNGYSCDSSGLLLHNNRIHGMTDEFNSGSRVTIQYSPHTKAIEFYIDGALQKCRFADVKVRKYQTLVPVVALSAASECVEFLSFDVD